jgi:membrane protease YdiL (CAAX protease family)
VFFCEIDDYGNGNDGPDFQLTKHDQLKSIDLHDQLPLQIIIVITTVIIAPIFEELLFRGLFQTMIGSFLAGSEFGDAYIRTKQPAWLAIICSSIIFASIHANLSHWPALFTLSVCLGYAYEKSGSILRPILIHIIFNAINIITALNKA